jgi:Tol biopolymer transport system component
MAQPFEPRRLEVSGEALIVAEHVGTFGSLGFFSISDNGVLIYRNGSQEQHLQLTWFDRQGKSVGTAGEPNDFLSAALSPDGARVAFSQFGTSRSGLWLIDVSRKTSTRFTFGPSVASPVWSPDGSRIVFSSFTDGYLYQKLTSGAKDDEPLVKSSENKLPTSWSRDGRFLLYTATDPKTKGDLWVLPFAGDKKPVPFLRTEFDERDGHFSPDGHWVAYTSNESGRNEIYVRAFAPDSLAAPTDAGGKWLISTDGGTDPRWRGDGKELYYRGTGGRLMAVEIATNPTIRAGIPQVLFVVPSEGGPAQGSRWDVTADGKRFLIPVGESTTTPFIVVQNWQAGLKK